MGKILLILIFIILASAPASFGLKVLGLNIDINSGLNLEWDPYLSYDTALAQYGEEYFNPDEIYNLTFSRMGVGAYIDAQYLRLGISYNFGLACALSQGASTETWEGETFQVQSADSNNTFGSFSSLDITLLGKFPFRINKSINIWPAAGIQYSILTSFTASDGSNLALTSQYNDMNDFYGLVGAGADYNLNNHIVITPSALFGFNWTPQTHSEPDPENTSVAYSGYKLIVCLSAGYRFGNN